MSKCDLCQKESGKQAEQRIGESYSSGQSVQIPYSMPAYCTDCEADIKARDADAKDIERIKREWYNYRHAGDETFPSVLQ